MDQFQCRSMVYDREYKQQKSIKDLNLFYKMPKSEGDDQKKLTYQHLLDTFSKFGEIQSCKISGNSDGTNKGFAYISFKEPEVAAKCVKEMGESGAISYFKAPDPSSRDPNKNINQVYFTFVPLDIKEDDLKKLFEPFGDIKSFIPYKNDKGQYGYVCFDDKTGKDKSHGPKAAAECAEKLNGHEFLNGGKMKVLIYQTKEKRVQTNLYNKINS